MTPGGDMHPEYPAQSCILSVILMNYKKEGNCQLIPILAEKNAYMYFPMYSKFKSSGINLWY